MDSREKLVKRIVKICYNEIVGGFENGILDGFYKEMPINTELVQDIYEEVMRTKAVNVLGGQIPVAQDIRFLGKTAILALIEQAFKEDSK